MLLHTFLPLQSILAFTMSIASFIHWLCYLKPSPLSFWVSHKLHPTTAFFISPFLSTHLFFLHICFYLFITSAFMLLQSSESNEPHSFLLLQQTTSMYLFHTVHSHLHSIHINLAHTDSWHYLFLFYHPHISYIPKFPLHSSDCFVYPSIFMLSSPDSKMRKACPYTKAFIVSVNNYTSQQATYYATPVYFIISPSIISYLVNILPSICLLIKDKCSSILLVASYSIYTKLSTNHLDLTACSSMCKNIRTSTLL